MINYNNQLRFVGWSEQGPDKIMMKAAANALRDVGHEFAHPMGQDARQYTEDAVQRHDEQGHQRRRPDNVGLPQRVLPGRGPERRGRVAHLATVFSRNGRPDCGNAGFLAFACRLLTPGVRYPLREAAFGRPLVFGPKPRQRERHYVYTNYILYRFSKLNAVKPGHLKRSRRPGWERRRKRLTSRYSALNLAARSPSTPLRADAAGARAIGDRPDASRNPTPPASPPRTPSSPRCPASRSWSGARG